tara:strand:- start:2687 stop:3580 length:894 start_codon:yes stop_codon:yes gene_type:complete
MPLLREEAAKLSNNDLVSGVIEEIIDKEALFELMSFVKTEGKAYVYNREKTISESEFIDVYQDVPEGAAKFEEITTKLRILAGQVDIDNFLAETMDDTSDQVAIQLAAKAKGLARKFRRTLAIGDSSVNPLEFDGVRKLATKEISAGVNGGALTFTMLDELCDEVRTGINLIMMRPGTIRAYRSLVRAAGGATPEHLVLKDFGTVIAHNGVAIIENEFLPDDETQGTNDATCSIYGVRLDEVNGLHGIWGGKNVGVSFQDLGTLENKDANRYRLKWYVGTALKATHSLVRLKGISNI